MYHVERSGRAPDTRSGWGRRRNNIRNTAGELATFEQSFCKAAVSTVYDQVCGGDVERGEGFVRARDGDYGGLACEIVASAEGSEVWRGKKREMGWHEPYASNDTCFRLFMISFLPLDFAVKIK